MDPILEQARDLDGRRLFFPPGQHPATRRLAAQIAKLEEYEHAGAINVDAWLDYHRTLFAAFEEGESLAKQAYLLRRR